jgi:uncharacterized protein
MTNAALPTRNGVARFAELDIARSIALFGIIILNYHGYLNGGNATGSVQTTWFARLMDPWNGLLTPSPVIFVVVAGVGCGLLTSASQQLSTAELRWLLIRRGTFLFTIGTIFEWVWNGTILPYYGIYFVLAAAVFHLKIKHIAALAAGITLAAALLSFWRFRQELQGHSTSWLQPFEPNTPRNLIFRYFIDYTHPVFPWFAFFCVGLIIGKSYAAFRLNRKKILFACIPALICIYTASGLALHHTGGSWQHILSTDPFQRGILATVGACTSAVLIVVLISFAADAYATTSAMQVLQRSGQITLTLYLCHAFIYNAVVHWLDWVQPGSFTTPFIFSCVVTTVLIAIGAWWQRSIGKGPVEVVYRKFGN